MVEALDKVFQKEAIVILRDLVEGYASFIIEIEDEFSVEMNKLLRKNEPARRRQNMDSSIILQLAMEFTDRYFKLMESSEIDDLDSTSDSHTTDSHREKEVELSSPEAVQANIEPTKQELERKALITLADFLILSYTETMKNHLAKLVAKSIKI